MHVARQDGISRIARHDLDAHDAPGMATPSWLDESNCIPARTRAPGSRSSCWRCVTELGSAAYVPVKTARYPLVACG